MSRKNNNQARWLQSRLILSTWENQENIILLGSILIKHIVTSKQCEVGSTPLPHQVQEGRVKAKADER